MKLATLILAVGILGSTFAVATEPTSYDCREVVRVKVYTNEAKQRAVKFIKVCPHTEQQKAGKCVSTFWGNHRCVS